MPVVWTRKASEQLDSIYEYIAQDSPVYALRFVEKIIGKVDLALTQPEAGRIVPEFDQSDVREIFVGTYRVIHWARDDGIEILAVIHGARLLPDNLGQ